MKLAEALSLRKDCQKKIEQLKGRITSNERSRKVMSHQRTRPS